MRKSSELHPSQALDFGPLFGGSPRHEHGRVQSSVVDPEERLRWARRALLASSLETMTAEDARALVTQKRPHFLGSGRWLGGVFHCPLFEKVCAENAKREEAAARTIWRYKLTADGEAARRKLKEARQ